MRILTELPEVSSRDDPAQIDAVLVTRTDSATVSGLEVMARLIDRGPVTVFGTKNLLDTLWHRLPPGPPGGWQLEELEVGRATPIAPGLSVTALTFDRRARFPGSALCFEGVERKLLYLPRGDAFGAMKEEAASWISSADVAILDGSMVRFDGQSRHDWTIESFLGEIDELRSHSDHLVIVLFTRLSVRNPFHHPAGTLREQLRRYRSDLVEDGTQFWL